MGFVMDSVQALSYAEWNPAVTPGQAADFAHILEAGRVLYLPQLTFELTAASAGFYRRIGSKAPARVCI